MKQVYLLIVFALMMINASYSQKTINGVLINKKDKTPIVNAYIQENNSNNIVATNELGAFEIIVIDEKSVLTITHINFKSLTIENIEKIKLNISMEAIPTEIDFVLIKRNALEDIAQSTTVTDDIKKGSQIGNVAELFNEIPGFSLQKRSATAIEPSFRSFKYEEMNLKYDGGTKVVHACPNRMDPITAHIIPEEVEKIEVIKGPYTVRFGQRFGPSVNMVTKTPSKDYGFFGKVEAGYETNGKNLLGSAQLKYVQKLYDFTLNGETRKFNDYVDGNGKVTPSGFSTNSYSFKAGFNPGEKHRLVISWREKFGKNIKHAGLPMDSPKDDSYVFGLDYKFNNVSKLVKSITFKTYASAVDHVMNNFNRPNFAKMEMSTPVQSKTYGAKFETVFTPSKNLMLFAGLDADIIERKGTKIMKMKNHMMGGMGMGGMKPMAKKTDVWQDAVIHDYGVFVEGSYKITKLFTATVGVRGDYVTGAIRNPSMMFVKNYGGKVENKTDVTVGANATLKYRSKGWQVQFAYGRGTRTASMVERYINRFTIGADPYEYIGNPNLKAEVNNQFELSFSKKIKKIHFGANAYYSIFEDYITAKLNPKMSYMSMGKKMTPKQFVNVDAYQFGFEAFFNYNFYKNVYFSSDVAYTSAFNNTFNEHLAQISPLTAHLGLKYDNKKVWVDLRSEFVLTQNQIAKSFKETITPGYMLLDLRAGFKPFKDVTLGVAVLNILDKAYYNHLNFSYKNSDLNSGKVYEAGRSFSVFAKYKF